MKKRKKIIVVIVVILVIISLIPFVPFYSISVTDGGTKGVGSLVYQVYKIHRFASIDENAKYDEIDGYQAYEVGWSISVFDKEIYKNTHIEQEKIVDE